MNGSQAGQAPAGANDEYRRQLDDALGQSSTDYDRTILTLSSGALAVSIAFLRDIAPDPSCVALVVVAWILLGLSLASTLLSHATSQKALLYSRKKLDEGKPDLSRGGGWGTATSILNGASGVTFLIGALLLIVFAIINLPEGR